MQSAHRLWIFLPVILLVVAMTWLIGQGGWLIYAMSLFWIWPAVLLVVLVAAVLMLASRFRPR